MKRLLTLLFLASLIAALSLMPRSRHSVMAGIQDAITPVAHAQSGGVYWNCDDLWMYFADLNGGGWDFAIAGEIDLGPVAYGIDVMRVYGYISNGQSVDPFYIDCYASWW